ncbi:MAG: NFACT family protein [Candidatus Micrarchaeota archaeon]|nr:NFACT family protein [Candidatus Micrarchaeota archaeon]MDE1849837.1 NFACT family protein [Candidatus Micrarchaeota archaeon]
MRELSAIELKVVVDGMGSVLANGYVRKFYELGRDAFRIAFYSNQNNYILYAKLARVMNLSEFAEEAGEATQFAVAMRKRIENAKVLGISQKGSDRIVIVGLEAAGKRYNLIIEMFGKGNVVLTDDNSVIELCYKRLRYADRAIGPKLKYEFPRSSSYAFEELSGEKLMDVAALAAKEDSKMIVALSKYINIGPLYMEDIILRTGLNPRERLKEDEIPAIAEELARFFERLKHIEPRAYIENGKIVDYSITEIRKYRSLESKPYDSIDRMLDELCMDERGAVEDPRKKQVEEIDANIRKQVELSVSMKKDSEDYANTARKIYENMGMINSIIGYFKSRKGVTLQDLRNEFGNMVKELDLKRKTVKIEVD